MYGDELSCSDSCPFMSDERHCIIDEINICQLSDIIKKELKRW